MRITLKNLIIPSIPLAVFLVGTCFILWISAYFGARYSTDSTQVTSIVESLQSVFLPNSLLSNLVCMSLTMLNAFLIAQINNRFTIIRTRTFLPIFIFLLLTASWNQTHTLIGSHISLTLFIFALFNFFRMARDRKASEDAFMGSLLISISSLLINPLIFIIPMCWIGFMMFQSFSLRTFLASVFGMLTPWILYLSIVIMVQPDYNLSKAFNINIISDLNINQFPLSELIYTSLMGIIGIIGIVGMYSITNSDAINTRNKLNFLLFLLISLFIFHFQKSVYIISTIDCISICDVNVTSTDSQTK